MPIAFNFENYTVTPEELEMEVNFIVSNAEGYVCRLVPGEAGFELSKADEAIGIEIPIKLLAAISDHIVREDA